MYFMNETNYISEKKKIFFKFYPTSIPALKKFGEKIERVSKINKEVRYKIVGWFEISANLLQKYIQIK